MAVKLVDHYLMKTLCKRENMKLVGASAILIAAKLEVEFIGPGEN